MTKPVNLAGLYSEFLVLVFIYISGNCMPKLTVETTFLKEKEESSAIYHTSIFKF